MVTGLSYITSKSKAHLTREGLEEIREIKSGMNTRREY